MFHGGPEPLFFEVPDPRKVGSGDDDLGWLARELGYGGSLPEAATALWADWSRFGACGEQADSSEQQAARYAGLEPEALELCPGVSAYELRDPEVLVTCGMDYLIRTWDVVTFKQLQYFEGHLNFVNVVEPYHGGHLLSCSDDGSLRLWKIATQRSPGEAQEWGELVRTIWVSYLAVKSLCTLPGCRAACGCADTYLRIVSVHSGEVLHKISEHAEVGPMDNYWQQEGCKQVFGLLHIRQNLMASCGEDTTVRFWEIDTMRCLGTHTGHKGWGVDASLKSRFAQRFAPVWRLLHLGGRGDRIASCSWDRTIAIWDVSDIEDVRCVRTLTGHDNSVINMCLLEEGLILSCSGDCTCKAWNVETGECTLTIPTHGHPTCAARLRDKRVVVGGADAMLRVYDWSDGREIASHWAHELSLAWMARLYSKDSTTEFIAPIMYRSTEPFASAKEQNFGPEYQHHLAEQAHLAAQHGSWL